MAGNRSTYLSSLHTELKVKGIDYRKFLKWEAVYTVKRLEELFVVNGNVFAFDTETTGLNPEKNKIAGFSFSFDGVHGYYVPLLHVKDVNAPRECLVFIVGKICDSKYNVLMYNKKFDLNMLEIAEGFVLGTRYNVYDVMALIWLRDTEVVMPSLKWASGHFLGITQPTFLEIVGDSTFEFAMVEDVCEYACLVQGTEIMTSKGIKKIEEIIPYVDKITMGGDDFDILALYDNGYKDVISIEMGDGYVFECTVDHKILCRRDIGYEWVEAGNLTDMDDVVSVGCADSKTIKWLEKCLV